MEILSVETSTHGRVLVEEPESAAPAAGLLVVFHGYGQNADETLPHARRIPGAGRWRIAAVEALSHFYTRGDERIVACWMTRQDREHAIADNIAYVDRAVELVARRAGLASVRPVFLGFSQGVGTAYRAALGGRHGAAGIIALGGDMPPEIRTTAAAREWPPVFIATGTGDPYYTPAKLETDAAVLRGVGVTPETLCFPGGHEWGAGFIDVAGRWISACERAR